MKISEFKTKWYYRLLRVIYYIFYGLGIITSLGIFIGGILENDEEMIFGGLIAFPGVIVGFNILKSLFYYIFWGKWEFSLIDDIEKISGKYNIDKYGTIGINRLTFNTSLIILFLFFIAITDHISYGYKADRITNVLVSYFILLIIFFYISFQRLHNIGKSGWNVFGYFIPIYQFYLLYSLIFKPGVLKVDDKIKKEKFWNIVIVLIFIVYSIISYGVKNLYYNGY